jgi:glycosyltransferase involved in cell wall biosynthesis
MQDYKNFHLVIIDDGSADGTGVMLQNMLKLQTQMDPSRWEVIIHTDRSYSVANIRNASRNFCTEKDIVIIVDGDD